MRTSVIDCTSAGSRTPVPARALAKRPSAGTPRSADNRAFRARTWPRPLHRNAEERMAMTDSELADFYRDYIACLNG